MSSRRFHRKSRHGCTQCKRRHIKCDEARPSCSNCSRAGVACAYEQGQSQRSPADVGSPASSPAASQISTPAYSTPVAFDLLDLSLMHHYTLSTSLGLFPGPNSREIWQKTLPAQAQSHPLLMHGLLALASMDLARTKPSERKVYATRALAHQHAGTRLFRSVLENVRPEDIHFIFTFSMILVMLAFAFPHTCDEPPDFDGILDLFSLVRGCRTVWALDPDRISASAMAHIIRHTEADSSLVMYPEVGRRFDTLRNNLQDPADILAADQLIACVRDQFLVEPDNTADLGRWPAAVSDAFWSRMQSHEPSALVVFAHFSVILGRFQHQWWTSNWDFILLQSIDRAMCDAGKAAVGWNLAAMVEFASSYKNK